MRDRHRLPANVVWLGVVSFLNDFSSEMIFPLLPVFFTTILGGGPALLGVMEGLVESVASLVKLYSGRLGDRLPRRKPLLLFGYGLASAARPVIAVATAPWQVMVLRVLDRLGKGTRGAPRDALIADSVDPSIRGKAFGFHRAMDHTGAIAGPVTALILISLLYGRQPLSEQGIRLLFGIAAIPALASMFVLAALVREVPRQAAAAGEGLLERRLDRRFWTLLGIILLFTLGNSSDAFLLLQAQRKGFSMRDVYLVWALLHVVKATLSTPAGALSDRIPRQWLIAAGWLVFAGVYLGFGLAAGALHLWILFAVYGVYFGLAEGTEKALVADLVPAEARGTAFGWYNGAVGLMALPASALFGLIWKAAGPMTAFSFGAGLAFLAALLLLLSSHHPRTPSPHQHAVASR